MKKISLQGDIIIRPMFLTVVSGRTLDNHMIVCGFAITFAECRDDIDFLNAAMIEAGVVLNDPRNTILSDRGTAEISFLQRSLPLAFEFHCGIHLERNLKSKGWSHWLPLYWKARNAPTIVEHMRCMSVIESSCKPMYEYLSKLNNWQLYQAVDTGHMLYDWKSDNIVEAIFAWCRETRFLNPYMFVKKFLVDILESNNRRKDDIARLQTVLHPQAEQHFHDIQKKVRHCPMEVHILDTVSERGIVHTITDAVHRSELRNVDLSKQKCDCGKYQQTGLPCKDAWFLLKELYPNGMPQDLFSEKYFHKDCFTMRVKNMFADVPELLGTIPSTSEVDNRLRSKSFRTIKAPLANDSKSYRSSKRWTSTGESSSTCCCHIRVSYIYSYTFIMYNSSTSQA
mmetsp:Transcript_18493/g.26856  ORF Transcript_18493/g.26856 Transcript_18493/m.26856 type:complete len:397 (+) Transcript_18493:530-1720(+)